jgi:catechol 2,3-dioxygenase-like lactoylglutathione lyase family enzyme
MACTLHFAPRPARRWTHSSAALAQGGVEDGRPGLRTEYHPDYYGAFVRDPDGNKIEACSHVHE